MRLNLKTGFAFNGRWAQNFISEARGYPNKDA